jgi:hypothetical protein
MIHQRRDGFILAGGIMLVPAYLLQLIAAAATSLSGNVSTCISCYKKEGELYLIPIVGPWLSNRAAPPLERGSSGLYILWGGLEAAGVAIILIGLAGHDVGPDGQDVPQGGYLSLLPFVTPRAEGLSLSMHW